MKYVIAIMALIAATSCVGRAPQLRVCWNRQPELFEPLYDGRMDELIPGFVSIDDVDAIAVYSKRGDRCPRPRPVRSMFDLPVSVYGEDRDVPVAANLFNEWGFRDVLSHTNDKHDADIFVQVISSETINSEQGAVWGTCSFFRDDDGREKAYIRVAGAHSLEEVTASIMHELGHAIGLAHNDFPGTLMSTDMWPGPDPEWPGGRLIPMMCDATLAYIGRL